jgi:prolyl-tRNA synthetase
VVVSGRGLESGTFEYRARTDTDNQNLDRAGLMARLGVG